MATRENQGLQIALIIFVILTIVLIVTTFLFYSNYNKEKEASAAAQSAKQKSDQDANEARNESEIYRRTIGAAGNERGPEVEKVAKEERDTYGEGLPATKQHYRALVGHLVEKNRKLEASNADLTARVKELDDKLKTNAEAAKAEVAKYVSKLTETASDLEKERKTFGDDRSQLTDDKSKMANEFEEKNKSRDAATEQSAAEIATLTAERGRIQQQLDFMKDKEYKERQAIETPDGKVVRVDQRLRMAWINLGWDDGLQRQTTFLVGPADDAIPVKAKTDDETKSAKSAAKGKLEVIRVTGAHQSEARIVEDDLSDPVVTGDQVFSIGWEPNHPEHFALAGKMDIDKDGSPDRQRIRDLISRAGGVIDAEVDEDGTKSGEMSVTTKYLVLGDRPGAESKNIEGYSDLITEAQKLGIKTIDVHDFLRYMGYTEEDRSVTLGRGAKATDFRPRQPEDVQRTMPGSTRKKEIRKPRPHSKTYIQ